MGANNGKQSDFKDGENAVGTSDYSFDGNGNLILDNNRRVSAVTYNYLDKPELITIAPPQGSIGGGTIRYIYAAGGGKLQVTGLKAPKNGYVLVFLSNGSSEPVYFDNFTVSHERGRLIEENHFYAYGLKIQAISSKALSSSLNAKMVNYGYQGAFSEEVAEFGLNYNEFSLRTYDPQIGQWTTPDPYDEFASPYTGMGNDPANNTDPSGGSIWNSILKFFGGTCTSSCPSALSAGATQTSTASFVTTVIRISTVSLAIGFGYAGEGINGVVNSSISDIRDAFSVEISQLNSEILYNGSASIETSSTYLINPARFLIAQSKTHVPGVGEDMEYCDLTPPIGLGIDSKYAYESTDNELFDDLIDLMKWTSKGEMEENNMAMIERFRAKTGGYYSNYIQKKMLLVP